MALTFCGVTVDSEVNESKEETDFLGLRVLWRTPEDEVARSREGRGGLEGFREESMSLSLDLKKPMAAKVDALKPVVDRGRRVDFVGEGSLKDDDEKGI